jgi:sugar O-acyltransferase (sialic acid O-acetyltransferase NeuD family)
LLGAGNQARETLGFYKDLGRFDDVKGLIEENCRKEGAVIDGKKVMDASVIGSFGKDVVFIGAIGSPLKKRWIEELELKGFHFDTVIHPSAIMGDFVEVAKGCIVCPHVVFTRNIKVGRHSIININSNISHDCQIGDFVTISPGVNLAGNVKIGDGCWIGIGATINQEVSIGKGSFIGAGAVVITDT